MIFAVTCMANLTLNVQSARAQNKVLPPVPVTPRAMPRISPKVRQVISKQDQALKRSEALRKLQERRKAERAKNKAQNKAKARAQAKANRKQKARERAAKDDRALAAPPKRQGAEESDKDQVISETGKAPENNLSEDFIKKCGYVKPKKNARFHLDIVDEELEAVVKLIACIKMRNIILSKPLKGKKITIYLL